MMQNNNLKKAIDLLKTQHLTCAIVKNTTIYTSTARGIQTLLTCYKENKIEQGSFAAYKFVGKAAAFLYVLLGVRALYADVISKPALAVLENANITVQYEMLTEAIRNRTDTGFCPMETAVWDINDASEALATVEKTLAKLQK